MVTADTATSPRVVHHDIESGPRGPADPGGSEMADKKIQPKAPEKTEAAAGARESAERETLRQQKRKSVKRAQLRKSVR